MALGVWRLALGAWRLALGAWRLALGAPNNLYTQADTDALTANGIEYIKTRFGVDFSTAIHDKFLTLGSSLELEHFSRFLLAVAMSITLFLILPTRTDERTQPTNGVS